MPVDLSRDYWRNFLKSRGWRTSGSIRALYYLWHEANRVEAIGAYLVSSIKYALATI